MPHYFDSSNNPSYDDDEQLEAEEYIIDEDELEDGFDVDFDLDDDDEEEFIEDDLDDTEEF